MKVLKSKLLPLFLCIAVMISLAEGLKRYISIAGAENTVIRVGSEVEFPPFAVVNKNGQADGFSVELIKAVADAMGLSITISTGTWDKMWNGLLSGELDVLPIVAISPNRKHLIDFSLFHTETFDAFFVRNGNPIIPNIEAAQDKTIVVMDSDAAHHELIERKFQGRLVTVETIPEGLLMVTSGQYDAFLCSKLIGILEIENHKINGLTAGPVIPDYKRVFAFGVRKGADELREKLNQGLLIVKSNGEYDRIYKRWLSFGEPITYKDYLLKAFPAAITVALCAILWSVMLRALVKRRTSELIAMNETLKQEIAARRRVEEELLTHKEKQELLIEERTKALQESENRYRIFFETLDHGVIYQNSEGIITDSNPASGRILGLRTDQMKSRAFSDFGWKIIHEDGSDFAFDQFPSTVSLTTGRESGPVIIGISSSEQEDFIWIRIKAVPYPKKDKAYQVYSIFEDITDKKLAENSRKWEIQSLRQYSKVQKSSVTSESLGVKSLCFSLADTFEQFVKNYAELMELALEKELFKVNHDTSTHLQDMAEKLGFLNASHRDLVDIHVKSLQIKVEIYSSRKAVVYADVGRLMLLELMGYLLSYYRNRAVIGLPTPVHIKTI